MEGHSELERTGTGGPQQGPDVSECDNCAKYNIQYTMLQMDRKHTTQSKQ